MFTEQGKRDSYLHFADRLLGCPRVSFITLLPAWTLHHGARERTQFSFFGESRQLRSVYRVSRHVNYINDAYCYGPHGPGMWAISCSFYNHSSVRTSGGAPSDPFLPQVFAHLPRRPQAINSRWAAIAHEERQANVTVAKEASQAA